jgi:hypothetical protein
MKHIKTLAMLAFFTASLACAGRAQSLPTASRQLDLSAFAAGTGTFTRIAGGKNLSITAGADLTYLSLRLLRPSLEIRGTYPIDTGHIDNQKSILAGPKVEIPFGRFHPYVDFLIGRGEIDYQKGLFLRVDLNCPGSPNCPITEFLSTTSTVYSLGGGLDYTLGRRIDVKADIQYQHWDVPLWNIPYPSPGVVYPVALTFGGVYHFNFNPRHRH